MKHIITFLSVLAMTAVIAAVPASAEETTAPVMEVRPLSTTTSAPFPAEDGETDKDALFTDVIWIYDASIDESVPGIEAQYVEYDADPSKAPDAQIIRVLETWNTSDSNPKSVNVYEFEEGHFYGVEIPQLPEGYSYVGDGYVTGYGLHNRTETALFGIELRVSLQPWAPLPEIEAYPVEDTVPVKVTLTDAATGAPISGVAVSCVQSTRGESNILSPETQIANWVTGEEAYAFELPILLVNERIGGTFLRFDLSEVPALYQNAMNSYYLENGISSMIDTLSYRTILRDGFYEMNIELNPEGAETEPPHTTTQTMLTTTATETTDTEPTVETPDCAEEPITTLPPESTTALTTTTAETTTTTTAPTTTTTVTTTAETSGIEETLPQTGMPWARPIAGLAVLMTLTGTAFVLKHRR